MDHLPPERRAYSLSTAAIKLAVFRLPDRPCGHAHCRYIITRVGLRAGISGAIVCTMAGALITLAHSLPIIILGLAMVSTGTFNRTNRRAEPSARAAPAESRVTAAGVYLTCYYAGGTAQESSPEHSGRWANGRLAWPSSSPCRLWRWHRAGRVAQTQRRRGRGPHSCGRPAFCHRR